ncbi:translation machinery-associated protein 16 homolog isoform X2 [Teleopsis dalmanni]|uniref:translation machinery-associated protein 16 homolog isoform X1 n=1 Tax=Teleopsis dalmanni TaxID=139649 RepID=UPI0018CF8BE8|nr:translation machinery-associated protein 16 homolog isoform X1 [Teleopsis dalmanni]XP_037942146.1 translation machinery-associated protein 16 homolog isoform X2 [Teleopsis dalmanni]
MTNLRKELEKCKHPNSRKTKALSKKARRQNNKHKSRLGHAIKSNLTGEKLNWFLEHIDLERKEPLSPVEFEELVLLYLKRFDEELEQIKLKQSISKNRSNQHIARENVIRITLEKEMNEFKSGGMEMINLCDPIKYKTLLDWDGSAINVQHLKLDLISQNFLQRLKAQTSMETATMEDTEIMLPSGSKDAMET